MHKLMLGMLLACSLIADICLAQANAINIFCEDCRDAGQYPDDYANFAFNQIYGPDAWLSFDQADDFFITNIDGHRVYVDVDYVMYGFDFEGFDIPFWPRNLLKITLALPDGRLLAVYRSVFQTSLPVPSSPSEGTTDTPSDDADEGGEDGDDYSFDEDFDWGDIEIDGYEGSSWIEDPDEYGNFDEVTWCEEC